MARLPKMGATIWIVREDGTEPGDDDGIHVDIRHPDRLVAEVALQRLGMNDADLAQTLTTAWAWAAAKREGHYTGDLAKFLHADVFDLAMDDDEEESADPTPPARPGDSP